MSEADLDALDEVTAATTIGYAGEQTVHNPLSNSTTRSRKYSTRAVPQQRSSNRPSSHRTVIRKESENRDAFIDFRTRCEHYGISHDLITMTSTSSPSDDSLPFGSTTQRYEALTLALSCSYYESPRQIPTEGLGISQPSLSRPLRRGERQLLSSALQAHEYVNTGFPLALSLTAPIESFLK